MDEEYVKDLIRMMKNNPQPPIQSKFIPISKETQRELSQVVELINNTNPDNTKDNK